MIKLRKANSDSMFTAKKIFLLVVCFTIFFESCIIDLEIKESMKYLVKEDRDRSAMLDIVQRISDLESMQDYKRKYAPEMTQAIIDNSYKIKVPFPILHKWNEKKTMKAGCI